MERRLRRQESASSALGGSSLPRPPTASASLNLPPTGSHAHGNANGGVVDPATAKQWEEYCAALESDHEELRALFDKQQTELTALASLLAEQKVKESHLRALEGQVSSHEQFLAEVLQVIALGDGNRTALKARREVNSAASGKSDSDGKSSIDAVRAAIHKQQNRLQTLKESEGNSLAALRSLRKENGAVTATALTAGSELGGVDCIVPAGAKEVEMARQQVRDLERRLQASERDARGLSAELKKAEQELKMKNRISQQSKDSAVELKRLLAEREALLSEAERRYKAVQKELRVVQQQAQKGHKEPGGKGGSSGGSDAAAAAADTDTTSNSVGDKRHTTTRHFRLLPGRPYLDLLRTQPAVFEEAFLRDTAAAVHVPVGFFSHVQMHAVGEDDVDHGKGERAKGQPLSVAASTPGVAVDLDIKHNASLSEETVDVLLLECAFPSLAALKEETTAKVNTMLRAEVAEMKSIVRQKESESAALTKRLRSLETSLARKDADRAANDKEVNGALEEAETTVKELYAALETHRESGNALSEDLAKAHADVAAWKAKAAAAEEQLIATKKSTTGKQTQLADAETRAKQLEKRYTDLEKDTKSMALQYKKEITALRESLQAANVEVGIGVFEFPNGGVKLPSADLVEAITTIAAETQRDGASPSSPPLSAGKRGIAKAFYNILLCEVAVATGTVPVQVTKCLCQKSTSGGASSGATLQLSFELAFYANPENTAHVRTDITEKLASCSFSAAIDFLQNQWELRKAATVSSKDKTSLEKRAKQLQDQLSAAEKKLDGVLTLGERKAAQSAVEKIDLLVARLRGVEASTREAKDSVATLHEKVKRLETALLEKQQQQHQKQRSANSSLMDNASVVSGNSEADDKARVAAREKELRATIQERQREVDQLKKERDTLGQAAEKADNAVAQLQQRVKALERKSAHDPVSTGSGERLQQLEEALLAAEKDRAALNRQMGEMETDMSDLSNIQASLQGSLEAAQTELRGKQQDLAFLAKRVALFEEQERKQKEEIKSLQAKLAAKVRDRDAEEENHEEAASPTPSTSGVDGGVNSNAPTRGRNNNSIHDGVRNPKNPGLPANSSAAAAASKRIMKRSGSAVAGRVFARTNSTPSSARAGANAPTVQNDSTTPNAATTTSGSADAADPSTAPTTTTVFTRSATVTNCVRASNGHGGRIFVDAPPRFGGTSSSAGAANSTATVATTTNPPAIVLRRQESRTYFTNAAAVLKGSHSNGGEKDVSANSPGSHGGDVASLTRERRHVSPVVGASSRQAALNAGAAFHRSQTTTSSSSSLPNFVRTLSGVRKANPNN